MFAALSRITVIVGFCLILLAPAVAEDQSNGLMSQMGAPVLGASQALSAQAKDWHVVCVSERADKRCTLTANQLTAEQATAILVTLRIVQSSVESPPLVLITTPLDLLLPKGADISVDARALGRLTFRSCHSDGCVVPMTLNKEIARVFKAGLSLTLTFQDLSGQERSAEYSLSGITRAFAISENFLLK